MANKIGELTRRKNELKRNFKDGVMSQTDYMHQTKEIKQEKLNLEKEAVIRDPFDAMFTEELSYIMYATDKRALIESIRD